MHSPSLGDDGVSSVWVECSKPLYNYIFWFELLRLNFNRETDEKLVLWSQTLLSVICFFASCTFFALIFPPWWGKRSTGDHGAVQQVQGRLGSGFFRVPDVLTLLAVFTCSSRGEKNPHEHQQAPSAAQIKNFVDIHALAAGSIVEDSLLLVTNMNPVGNPFDCNVLRWTFRFAERNSVFRIRCRVRFSARRTLRQTPEPWDAVLFQPDEPWTGLVKKVRGDWEEIWR